MTNIDKLIVNANILTLDDNESYAGSVAIASGVISHIWEEQYPPCLNDLKNRDDIEIIDVKGKTILPGFIDTHNHLLMYSQNRAQVNCSSPLNKNINDLLNTLERYISTKAIGEWVIGWGYDDTLLDDQRHPTKVDLDKVSPNNPMLIRHISGHFAVVNSVALKLAGVDDNVSDPSGGHFGRDNKGTLNGVLYEFPAMKPFDDILPEYSQDDLISLIEQGAEDYLSVGITTSTDAGVGLVKGDSEYDAHIKSVQLGKNPLRMRYMILHNLLSPGSRFENLSFTQLKQKIEQDTNGRATLDSAKLFQDGSIQGMTGALREPYFCDMNHFGNLIHDQNYLNEEVYELHKRGFRIAIHGNGDKAIASIIESYSMALKRLPKANHRHRIEHVQTATKEDLKQMKELGIEASFFINHVYYWGERHKKIFLGESRAKRINPLRDAMDLGFKFTLHSDCPITPISPLFSIWAAVNRRTTEGSVLGEDQKIDVITALKSMTIYGAWLNFEEDIAGSIEIGKQADFIIVDKDPLKVNVDDIKDISILSTFISGKEVYSKKQQK
ncbi:amidohydrolase [Evansella tamaricis]|uniref:Amidohydrolase n=1 Tax=Evansella tamaricis TaxID=2069301 RepID=A0ABS6JIZ4_9BACI|nr:amidohydrolase [Evansella tamaricis]MBU9713508.1 amidohydrolase [Evansella tamaricis]